MSIDILQLMLENSGLDDGKLRELVVKSLSRAKKTEARAKELEEELLQSRANNDGSSADPSGNAAEFEAETASLQAELAAEKQRLDQELADKKQAVSSKSQQMATKLEEKFKSQKETQEESLKQWLAKKEKFSGQSTELLSLKNSSTVGVGDGLCGQTEDHVQKVDTLLQMFSVFVKEGTSAEELDSSLASLTAELAKIDEMGANNSTDSAVESEIGALTKENDTFLRRTVRGCTLVLQKSRESQKQQDHNLENSESSSSAIALQTQLSTISSQQVELQKQVEEIKGVCGNLENLKLEVQNEFQKLSSNETDLLGGASPSSPDLQAHNSQLSTLQTAIQTLCTTLDRVRIHNGFF